MRYRPGTGFLLLLLLLTLVGCAQQQPTPGMTSTAPAEVAAAPATLAPKPAPTHLPTAAATPRRTATPQATLMSATAAPAPALPERRRLNLDYPAQLRVGDADWVTLTLEVDEQGNLTPTVSAEGHTVTGEVIEVPNLYDTHYVQAEARLDVAGMQIAPQGAVFEPLQPGRRTTFRWSVRATEAGLYRGTLSLHLRFIPKAGGPEQRLALRVLPLVMDARTLFGLNGHLARLIGWLGSLLGSVFSLGDLLPWLLKRLSRGEK